VGCVAACGGVWRRGVVWCGVVWCCVVWCGVVYDGEACVVMKFLLCLCKKRRSVVLLHFCTAWVCVSCVGVASVNAHMCVGVGL
jgi:hypothetical protein